MKKKMKPKAVIKIIIDGLMTLVLLFLMGYPLWGDIAHEWVGTLMMLLFIAHHLLNRHWYSNLFKGRFTCMRIFQIVVNMLLFITMLFQMYSGITMSRHVFAFLPIQGGMALARRLHILGAYWGFILMSIHLGLHWNMVLGMAKRIVGKTNPAKFVRTSLFILSILIADYGVFVFIDRNFLTYMFLRSEFVFLDYGEPLWSFYLDYISLMGLWIFISHYLLKWLKKRRKIMQYTKLGNSDLIVSRICMGCMGFGDPHNGQHSWTLDEAHSREIIHRGLELGVNFFDTAVGYQSGTSEQYLGRALKDFAKREDVVVATKFLPRTQEEIDAGISGQQHIQNMIDTSLRNLGLEYVDLYIYHMWDYNTPLYDIMDGLNRIVKAGKARYIGISNCFAYQLAKANALAEKEGFTKFISVQGHYNLIFREEEREMAKLCLEDNIAMTPYSSLAGGRLSKHPGETSKRLEEDSYAKFKYDATAKQDGIIIDRVAKLAQKHGVSMTEISLAWLLTKVTSPIVGATKLHHIEGAVKAVDLILTPEECAYLEEPYVPHKLVGVMAQNTPAAAKQQHVWSTGNQKIQGR